MVEIKEVLRLWRAGTKKKRIAAQLTLDVKTVRRYVGAAESSGLAPGPDALTDEQVAAVVAALSPDTGRPHGDGWQQCETERAEIERLLLQRVRLSKVQRLLHRRGIELMASRTTLGRRIDQVLPRTITCIATPLPTQVAMRTSKTTCGHAGLTGRSCYGFRLRTWALLARFSFSLGRPSYCLPRSSG